MAPPIDRIRRVGETESDMFTYYPVLIIGAGESGIAMGCRLRADLDCDQFRIFERKSAIGGTWFTNKYPGVACDVYGSLFLYAKIRD
jgi:cation diffusion facilitator CzcD-associated flavoprotein CzcO